MSEASWESEYQQNPYIVGGGQIPIEKLRVLPAMIDRKEILCSVRAWDKAGSTEEEGAVAFTAGVLMHKMRDGRFVIEDVIRGHWSALDRENRIKAAAEADRALLARTSATYKVVIEQEPGSGGEESAEATVRNLAGFNAAADRVTGKGGKEVRAEPFVAQCQGGNVWLFPGNWVRPFIEEAEPWPFGRTKDQVDAAAMASTHLTMEPVIYYGKAFE